MSLVFDSLFAEFMSDGKEPSEPNNTDGKAEPSKHLTETAKPRDEPTEPNPDDKTSEEITNLHNSISELAKGFEELKKVISEQQKIIEEKGENNNGDNQE